MWKDYNPKLDDDYRAGLLLGYRYEHFEYDMYDMYYEIDRDQPWRQGTETNVGQKVLTYEISYRLPYVGLAFDWRHKRWGLGIAGKYSFYPTAKDKEEHLLRNLVFSAENDKNGEVWLADAYAFWYFLTNWKLACGFDFAYMRIDGDTWDSTGAAVWQTEQSTDARHFMGWVGVEYEF